jgi:hypothetical protein
MFTLATQRRRSRGSLSWVLAYLLLAQALIPIQAHTQWATTPDGIVVVICTLQGERSAVLGGDTEDTQMLDEYRSPACVFSSLLGSTIASDSITEPTGLFLAVAAPPGLAQDRPSLGPKLSQAIRAPPHA